MCDVTIEGRTVIVDATIWYRDVGGGGCSEDCGGADGTLCFVESGLPPGEWTFVAGESAVTVTVPLAEPPVVEGCF